MSAGAELPGGARSVTIVGAGQAGGWLAATLRADGFTGPVSLIGDEPHPPYERPPLSKEALLGTRAIEQTYLKPTAFYAESGIALRTGMRVAAIDRAARRLTFENGSGEDYELLVLATGSRARRLALPGATSPRIHYLRDIADMQRLRAWLTPGAALAIVGGGFIGLEIAAAAATLGCAVTVLEQAPTLIGRVLPRVVSDHLARRHAAAGVTIVTDARVSGFVDHGAAITVECRGAGSITADQVVVGIGAVPNDELATAAGLAVDDGIVVDASGRTSDPHIRAAGDVTRHFNPLLDRHVRLESWHNAQNQAIAVAHAITGADRTYAEVPWLWSDQYDVNLQVAGLPVGGERVVLRGDPGSGRFAVFLVDGDRLSAAFAINQPRDMRAARQILTHGLVVDAEALADPARPLPSPMKQAA